MLVFHSQMPQPVVAGIPFSIQNRLQLTSLENFYGKEGKIEKTTQFIFDELIPHLNNNFKTGRPVLIFGHSRTGFLTSFFMVNRREDFDLAGSFSGFFEKGFELNDIEKFLINHSINPNHFGIFFPQAQKPTKKQAI
jgi:hypothetical protein